MTCVKMDNSPEPIILISSDSSAPSSPEHGTSFEPNKGSADCHNSDSDAGTIKYFPKVSADCHNSDSDAGTIKYFPLETLTQKSNKAHLENTVEHGKQVSDSDEDFPQIDFLKRSTKRDDYFVPNIESQDYTSTSGVTNILKHSQNKIHELSDSEDSNVESQRNFEWSETWNNKFEEIDQLPSATSVRTESVSWKQRGKQRAKNTTKDAEKERKKAERMQIRAEKLAEQAKNKAAKLAAAEAHRSKKPGECLKHIKVCLDQQLLTAVYGGELLVSLQTAELQYNIQTNPVPFSIIWIRETRDLSIGNDMKVQTNSKEEEENEILIVWHWDKIIQLIQDGNLTSHVQTLKCSLPGKKLTLVIYGIAEYFRYQKTFKRREVRAQVLGTEGKSKTSKKEGNFENAPRVSQDDWETALTELQLFANCSCRLIDKPQDLGLFVRQFTKAVAEMPFKKEKHKREQEKLEWYAAGDSRDCVRVDKNGNGLLRLWQQQLCQFSRVSMETAQAISSRYRSPSALVQAYENCSSEREAKLLLEAIPIRREVGPLTAVKKVGPELSKRVYTFFTALDEGVAEGQE